MSQYAEIIDLGFSVADAEGIKFRFDGENLYLEFTDWQEESAIVRFENTIGYRYQLAEYSTCDNESYDSVHIIKNSDWLKTHREQNEAWDDVQWYHYKLNFNAGGVIEVLCTKAVKHNKTILPSSDEPANL